MKTNQHQVTSKNSRPSAAPQPKTAHSRAGARPESNPPCIALFPQGDTSASEEIIDLSKAEYAALKRAAAPSGDGILMFMANAALEKIGWLGSSSPSKGGLIITIQPSDGGERIRVEFSPEERCRIEAAVKLTKMPLADFIERAIGNYVGCPEFASILATDQAVETFSKAACTRTGRSPHLDLEDSINQASALLDLLGDRYWREADGARGAGLDKMVRHTISNLHGDFGEVLSEQRKEAAGERAPIAKAAV